MKESSIFKILLFCLFIMLSGSIWAFDSCRIPGITSGMVQYRPNTENICETEMRTCCNDGLWSKWGQECPSVCEEGFGPYMMWDPAHPRPSNLCENEPGYGCFEFVPCGGPEKPCPMLRSAVKVDNIQTGFSCGQGYNPPNCQNKYSPKCSDSEVSTFCRRHNGGSGTKCPYEIGYEEGPVADDWCRTSGQSQCIFYGNAASYAGEQACSKSYAFRADNTAYCQYTYATLNGFRCIDNGEEDTTFEYYHICGDVW